jgi:6-phosphogluconate dehydrogenase
MAHSVMGMIGLAVMGKNLARNIAGKKLTISVYNRSYEKTATFLSNIALDDHVRPYVVGTQCVRSFVASLSRPRAVMIMVKAGAATDEMIAQLLPYLEVGDIIIDGGNAHFSDTLRRSTECAAQGIRFIGCGVSGGEEGALRGPALMPGGSRDAYEVIAPIFEAIAAHVDGEPCCAYIGPDGAGHYVKMVHNGIEYGDMQLICEVYHLMRDVLGLGASDIGEVFSAWNEGELDSYLIDITARIMKSIDPHTGAPLVDVIMDRAGQKGTGVWTSVHALELGMPLSIITSSVFARMLSAQYDERHAAGKVLKGPRVLLIDRSTRNEWIERLRQALYVAKICSYAQGFAQLRMAAQSFGWTMPFVAIAKLFRGGCIIRARFLRDIAQAFEAHPQLANLLLYDQFRDTCASAQSSWRAVVSLGVRHGIPLPALSASLAYYDSYRSTRLPANLLQAQRDFFGAHTFERIDRPGAFHHMWT